MSTGTLDASKLEAKNINAKITSHGDAIINATESIDANVYDMGKLVYLQEPPSLKIRSNEDGDVLSFEESQNQEVEKEKVQYVKVKLKNNRFTRIQTYVQGPKNRRFSYGMPFNAKQTRSENYPVGTRIFKVNKFGMRKLLVTVKAEDAGKVVKLFEQE
jgi:hypothetical protein